MGSTLIVLLLEHNNNQQRRCHISAPLIRLEKMTNNNSHDNSDFRSRPRHQPTTAVIARTRDTIKKTSKENSRHGWRPMVPVSTVENTKDGRKNGISGIESITGIISINDIVIILDTTPESVCDDTRCLLRIQ